MKKKGIRVKNIVTQAGYKRGAYYLHIKRKDLSLEILKKYATALDYDFSNEIPELKSKTGDPEAVYTQTAMSPEFEALLKDRDSWKDKFIELSAKHNELSEKYVKLIEAKDNNQP